MYQTIGKMIHFLAIDLSLGESPLDLTVGKMNTSQAAVEGHEDHGSDAHLWWW